MDLQTVKYGLAIAACGIMGVIVFFALYVKMGEWVQNRTPRKD
jgi:hypothetical protein